MVELAPGVPIPLPPQGNSTLNAFGKGLATGLESYIERRMKQKEAQELFEMELDKNNRKNIQEIAKKALSGELDISTLFQPQVTANIPVPTSMPQSLSLIPEGGLPVVPPSQAAQLPQGLVPSIPPTTPAQIQQNVLQGLSRGDIPQGYKQSYDIKPVAEQKQFAGYTSITPSNQSELDLFKSKFKGYKFDIGKVTQIPTTTYNRAMYQTQQRDYNKMTNSELNQYINNIEGRMKAIAPDYPYVTLESQTPEYLELKESFDEAFREQSKRAGMGGKPKSQNVKFMLNNTEYSIPQNEVASFLSENPTAKRK